jgi:hypothetical protein
MHEAGFDLYAEKEPSGIPAIPDEKFVYVFAINWAKGTGYFYETIDQTR